MPLFIQRLVKKFDIYGEGAPFIRALKKVYGEPCDEEKVPEDIARNTMLVWYLEEFFTLSIQEAVLFDDGGKVVDRMAATGEITNAGEIKDFVNSVLEEPEMQKFLNQLYAETLYDSLKELIPDMCDLMRRNVKTYAIEPDASRDYRDLEEAYLVKTERRLRNKRAHPGHARSYLADENWVENVKRTFEKMSEAFYADVTAEGIYATNPTRMVIRLLSPDGKDVEEEKDKIRKFIADRLRTLVSKDRRFSSDTRDSVVSTIVDRKIKFVTAYVEDMKYLNTVPDLFMDITMMELDRYEEGADGYGDEDTPPEGLVRRFLHLLKLSTNNFLEIKAAIENDGNELNIANILKKIFGGFVLRIRPIDWKELSVWKKSQDEILHAL